MRQEYAKARPVIRIGSPSTSYKGNSVRFNSCQEATHAWLMLASMEIPAYLDAALDGWYPNDKTTAWGKPTVMDYTLIPDIKLCDPTDKAVMLYSKWMRCEFVVAPDKLFETIASVIREWQDIVESEQ